MLKVPPLVSLEGAGDFRVVLDVRGLFEGSDPFVAILEVLRLKSPMLAVSLCGDLSNREREVVQHSTHCRDGHHGSPGRPGCPTRTACAVQPRWEREKACSSSRRQSPDADVDARAVE